MQELEGKVAVVTGAASGIGRALAQRSAAEGMKVVLADIEDEALAAAAGELQAEGAQVLAVRTDVSKAEEVEALAEKAVDAFGAVHLVCNNAGVGSSGAVIWEETLHDWEWVMGVNLWGVIHGIRAFVPRMLAQDTEGHIVNTASMAGHISGAGLGVYKVTKFGVVTISETLCHELAQRDAKIKVSVLCPGFVNTRIGESERNRPGHLRNDPGAETDRQARRQSLDRLVDDGMAPAEVAGRVFEAIRNEKLYILTHPRLLKAVKVRMDDILQDRNPRFRDFTG
ncbi:MAG: SDR family NAD(P)-dependent oxidoreductase [Chloroflexi bacterium]|nr:SDR family NAD(P)-dependent oxidoreductase [Chloroflexota bacterium]MCI0769211.1 SDR family NAD(P)-dependent oxidoreductase [Chloroflexota bacterium]